MKFFYLLIGIVTGITAQAQIVKQPLSVQSLETGAYSRSFSDIFSATANQASLAQLKTGAFGVYGERKFLLQELNEYSAIVAVPASSGVFGFQADYFGSAAFNENQLGILYGRKVSEHLDVGTKFNYYTVRIPGYGSQSSVNFEAGAIFHLTDKLHTGIHAYNPTGSKLGKNRQEKLASVYRLGIGYEVSEIVFVGAEILKQENQHLYINAGLQYNFQQNIFIRTGISTLTNNSYAAIGFQLSFTRLFVNASYHPHLGITPGLLLLFNLKKEGKD